MAQTPASSGPTSPPLAAYSERLVEVRRTFTLHEDRVVVSAWWLLKGRHRHVVRLGALKPEYRRLIVRYRLYRYAGWILALGSLAFAVSYYQGGDGPWGWLAMVALPVAALGAILLAFTYPLRMVHFVRFDADSGRPGLDIGAAGSGDSRYWDFVRAVKRQIERQ